MGEFQLRYLDMLQSVISRMASNEFTCRAWSITLGTAIIGYAASKDGKPQAALLALMPVFCFWVLDAYYLALERAFRKLFELAPKNDATAASFSFKASPKARDYLDAAFSLATVAVHLPVAVVAVVVGVYA